MAVTSSRTTKQQSWLEITMQHMREQLMSIVIPHYKNIYPGLFPSRASTYIPESEIPLPPAPDIHVCDDINAMLFPYQQIMVKTKFKRFKMRFKALVLEWFLNFTNIYFPEDTGKLISSYNEIFQRNLRADIILIHSDIPYAGLVEEMEGVTWSKHTAIDHAAKAAGDNLKTLLPNFIEWSYHLEK
jgi:hypothetical protein